MALLSKITNRENTNQFKLVKDLNSNRVNDLLIHNTKPVTLYNNLLTFQDTDKKFKLQDLLKLITNRNYNVDLAKLSDKKIIYDFAKEMYFDEKAPGNKRTRGRSLIILLNSPAKMVSASGVSSLTKRNLSQKQNFCHPIPLNYVIEKNYYES